MIGPQLSPLVDDLDFGPLDDAHRAGLPPEILAMLESAEERIAAGTARILREEDLPAADEEILRMKAG